MEFFEINPEYAERPMLIDDMGNRVKYGDFADFYIQSEKKL